MEPPHTLFPSGTKFFEAVDSAGDGRAFALVPVTGGRKPIWPTGKVVSCVTWGSAEMSRADWLAKYPPAPSGNSSEGGRDGPS